MAKTRAGVRPIRIFISYAHEDESHRVELQKFIRSLKNGHLVEHWSDRRIVPGDDWDERISEELNQADIVLMLISADFLDSEYVRAKEIPHALSRRDWGVRVIPIIVRHLPEEWGDNELLKLQALPTDRRPVEVWESRDEAYSIIASAVGRMIDDVASSAPRNGSRAKSEATAPSPPIAHPLADGPAEVPTAHVDPPAQPFTAASPRLARFFGWRSPWNLAYGLLAGLALGLTIGLWAVPPLWNFRPSNAIEYNLRGELRFRAFGDLDGALEDFQRAVACEPRSPRLLHNLGLAYLVRGEYAPAVTVFGEAISKNRTFLEAHNDLCVAYVYQRKYPLAEEVLERAKDIVADHPWTLKNRGFILYMQDKYELAIVKYTEAIHKDPNYFEAYLYRSWAHAQLGRRREAAGDHYIAVSGDRALGRRVDPKARP